MKTSGRNMDFVLAAMAIVAVFGAFSGGHEPVIDCLRGTAAEKYLYRLHTGNEIFFSLSIGFLISLILWILVVRLPEARKRKILKDNLARQYQDFKEGAISIFLLASTGSYDSELPKKLCDYREFKDYFNENDKQNWYDALNGLEEHEGLKRELLVEAEFLADEGSYVLNNLFIDDDKVHSFWKRLSRLVRTLKDSSDFDDDHVRKLSHFIWQILAQWNFTEGQREDDIIQEMIDGI